VVVDQLALAWEELARHSDRRERARLKLEELYDEARREDPRMPEPVKGVASKIGLARLFAETGPLDDFASWRQVLRYGGLNLCERKSGKYKGQTKISRKGRPQLRRILNELVLPLVRRNSLFGEYYQRKTKVEKMSGTKAMTAVSRKFVKNDVGLGPRCRRLRRRSSLPLSYRIRPRRMTESQYEHQRLARR
jgi:transposase